MTTKRILILAPHIDDELIGCFSVFAPKDGKPHQEVHVVWFYDITAERLSEAHRASEALGFTYSRDGFDESTISQYDEVYVPARQDWHADHRRINNRFREHATHFYSVDMVEGKRLTTDQQRLKQRLLNKLYPSQSLLWERDEKYWLFESIRTADYKVYTRVLSGTYEIECLKIYKGFAEVELALLKNQDEPDLKAAFNSLVSMCSSGRVVLRDIVSNTTWEI